MLTSERLLLTIVGIVGIVVSVAIVSTPGLAEEARAEEPGPGSPAVDDSVAGELAVRDALAWLDLVDRGSSGESWDAAAPEFRRALIRERWEQKLAGLRPKLGPLVSRRVKSIRRASSIPGAPKGDYVIIQFATSFEKKKNAVETVTSMRQPDNTWKVARHAVKS